jgi:hypothetical protein
MLEKEKQAAIEDQGTVEDEIDEKSDDEKPEGII